MTCFWPFFCSYSYCLEISVVLRLWFCVCFPPTIVRGVSISNSFFPICLGVRRSVCPHPGHYPSNRPCPSFKNPLWHQENGGRWVDRANVSVWLSQYTGSPFGSQGERKSWERKMPVGTGETDTERFVWLEKPRWQPVELAIHRDNCTDIHGDCKQSNFSEARNKRRPFVETNFSFVNGRCKSSSLAW